MCDENGLFAEAEVADGMLISRRKFKRGVESTLRLVRAAKQYVICALDLYDFSAFLAVVYCMFVLLLGIGLLYCLWSVYQLLSVSKAIVLPLGSSWSP